MPKDSFGYGTNKISEEEFKQAWMNELGVMKMMNNPNSKWDMKLNPDRENLKIFTSYLMQNKAIAHNFLKSNDENIVKIRKHLYPELEKDRWGMSEKEWKNKHRHRLSPMRLFN